MLETMAGVRDQGTLYGHRQQLTGEALCAAGEGQGTRATRAVGLRWGTRSMTGKKVIGFMGIPGGRAHRTPGHSVIGGKRPSAAQTTCLFGRSLTFALASGAPTPHNNEVSARAHAARGRGPSGHPPRRGSDRMSGGERMVRGICS